MLHPALRNPKPVVSRTKPAHTNIKPILHRSHQEFGRLEQVGCKLRHCQPQKLFLGHLQVIPDLFGPILWCIILPLLFLR